MVDVRRMASNAILLTVLHLAAVAAATGTMARPPASPHNAAGTEHLVRSLSSSDAALRFEAALELVPSRDPNLDALLEQAARRDTGAASPAARAAVEFVLEKRSHRSSKTSLTPSSPPSPAMRGTNVLLISVDTLRADHLGCYGYPRETSPVIDAMAGRGALFLNAFSPAPWTLPSHMSILTSLYPSFHKIEKGGKLGSARLDPSEEYLAQRLKGAGFATTGMVAHPYLAPDWGFDRGFDFYRVFSTRADRQTDRALLWLEWHRFHADRGLAPSPYFLFLHYIDPHETYHPPEPYLSRFTGAYDGPLDPTQHFVTLFKTEDFESPADLQYVQDLYDGEINFVDTQLGRLFRGLRETGLESSTVVIFTSDHGEELKDHGSMGHKATLYDEQLRVPLIIVQPGRIDAGQRIKGPVSVLDIAPTILEMVGVEPLAMAQGISLVSTMTMRGSAATAAPPPRDFFAELGPIGYKWERRDYRRAIRRQDDQLIYLYTGGGALRKEFYDLRADPGETRNLYPSKEHLKATRRMEKDLEEFIRRGADYNPGFRDRNEFQIDEELRDRLRSLGYID